NLIRSIFVKKMYRFPLTVKILLKSPFLPAIISRRQPHKQSNWDDPLRSYIPFFSFQFFCYSKQSQYIISFICCFILQICYSLTVLYVINTFITDPFFSVQNPLFFHFDPRMENKMICLYHLV